MLKSIVILVGLILGYFMHILTRLMNKDKPDIRGLDDYIKKENVQVIFHGCALYVIGTLWLKTDMLNLIPKSMWFAPLVGFATPKIWDALTQWMNGLLNRFKK